ncbi:MAG: DUF5680 domain-containing protein [Candidatus Caldatribacteriaceae bacterium]
MYYRQRVFWAMNYFGRILRPEHITSAEAGRMIKVSLLKLYAEGWFLVGFEHTEGELTYTDTNEGDIEFFVGRKWISHGGLVVYELLYHGGLIKG